MGSLIPAGTQLGEFCVLGHLGEGAMGQVYRAEQSSPRREVALKLMKPLAAGSAARFAREIELMAQIEHPQIARLYAAGEFDWQGEALSWFAMELVDGAEMDLWLQRERPPLAHRLRLLAQIARAVHALHTHGIVHRDLKPSNILIDRRGVPRIVDFGIARLVDASAGPDATRAGDVLGSVPYISPEQLAGQAARAGPAADVYALGVLAYEMLAETHPFPGLRQLTVLDALHHLRTTAPPPLRRARPGLSRDVETVVMTAMESDPSRRYGSALALADDLERIHRQQPISTRPPSLGYTLSLALRRHRVASAAGILVLLALLGAATISTRFGLQEAAARAEAEQRIDEYQAVLDFVARMFNPGNRDYKDGPQLRVADMLDDSLAALEASENLSGRSRATLTDVLASGYQFLGDSTRAMQLKQTAARLSAASYGESAPETIAIRKAQVQILTDLGRNQEAAEAIEALLAAGFPDTAAGRYEHAGILTMAAVNAVERGAPQVALAHIDTLFADPRFAAALKSDGLELNLLYWRSRAQDLAGDLEAAIRSAEETLARAEESLDERNPGLGYCLSALARFYSRAGRYAEAEPLLHRSMRITIAVEGPEHFAVAARQRALAEVLLRQGELDEARQLARTAGEAYAAHSGTDTREYLDTQRVLAEVLAAAGDPAAAGELLDPLLEPARSALGPGHPQLIETELVRALIFGAAGRPQDQHEALRSLWKQGLRHLGPEHYLSARVGLALAASHLARRETAVGRQILAVAAPVIERHFGPQHPDRRSLESLRRQLPHSS